MELEEFIERLEEESFKEKKSTYKDFLLLLIKKYKSISSTVMVLDYSFKKGKHYLELKIDNLFFEINVSKKGVHIILNEFEDIFFFDDDFFSKSYKDIIESLFDGDYSIFKFGKEKSKSTFFSLRFKNQELLAYNQQKESERKKNFNIIDVFEGIRLRDKPPAGASKNDR